MVSDPVFGILSRGNLVRGHAFYFSGIRPRDTLTASMRIDFEVVHLSVETGDSAVIEQQAIELDSINSAG